MVVEDISQVPVTETTTQEEEANPEATKNPAESPFSMRMVKPRKRKNFDKYNAQTRRKL